MKRVIKITDYIKEDFSFKKIIKEYPIYKDSKSSINQELILIKSRNKMEEVFKALRGEL